MIENWSASFKDLREAKVRLADWLEYHKIRRATLAEADRLKESRKEIE